MLGDIGPRKIARRGKFRDENVIVVCDVRNIRFYKLFARLFRIFWIIPSIILYWNYIMFVQYEHAYLVPMYEKKRHVKVIHL